MGRSFCLSYKYYFFLFIIHKASKVLTPLLEYLMTLLPTHLGVTHLLTHI